VSPILRRIAEIERLIEQATAADPCERPVHELTDTECAMEWRKLCHRQVGPRPEPMSPEQEAELVRQWRELTG
jgi:hypothetical protein